MGIEVCIGGVRVGPRLQRYMESILADSMFFVGFFFGAGLLGQLADIKGRWVAMYTSLAIAATGAAASAASRLLAVPHLQTTIGFKLRRYRSVIVRPEH